LDFGIKKHIPAKDNGLNILFQKTWVEAAAECCARNMSLIAIETQEEKVCLQKMVQSILYCTLGNKFEINCWRFKIKLDKVRTGKAKNSGACFGWEAATTATRVSGAGATKKTPSGPST